MTAQGMFSLDGKTAVVTGSRRGIGRAIAEGLAAAGADIVGVSAQMAEDGGETGAAVRALGRRFTPMRCDFADRASVAALAAELAGHTPRIDILVNNAGTIRRAPAAEHPDADWYEVLEVNLSAQFVLSREVGATMLAHGGGKIIFTASLLTFQGGITVPGYAASKGGIGQLTKALANEWGSRGVNVNAIAPGYIRTANPEALQKDKPRHDAILDRIPAGRWGEAQDLAGAAVFLASPASDYVHGVVLPVDGGWLGR